jgi:putative FmdB family regulatory protein
VPIYEYKCPEGHVFELFQRFADAPAETCQVCGASPVVKVLYPAAVHFKGSGFYTTDYQKAGKKRGGSGSGEGSSSSSDGGSSSSSSSSDGGSSSSGDSGSAKTEKPASSSKD